VIKGTTSTKQKMRIFATLTLKNQKLQEKKKENKGIALLARISPPLNVPQTTI